MHPPEQAVHPPKRFSIKTRYLFHKRAVILIEVAVLFFLCYDERRDEAESLPALPKDDW